MRAFLYSLAVVLILSISAIGWVFADFTRPGPLEIAATQVFPPGDRFTHIADRLGEAGVIRHPFLFKLLVFLRGDSARFKAGEYIFPPQASALDVSSLMASGRTVVHHLTIPEGLMTSEILALVKANAFLDGEITLDVKEGELLPETYHFSRGDKRNALVARMQSAMRRTLSEAWAGRAASLPFSTPQQALTLASIVERETGVAEERPHVASVYINRLNKGMLLQADPTNAYGVTMGKHKLARPLSMSDLQMDSPYNSYRIRGLPPGPIANPGRASILATLHPIASEDYYFVATGTGGHNFARTEAEHNENVKKYRALGH